MWVMVAVVAATLSVAAATLGAQQGHGTQAASVTATGAVAAPSYVLTDQAGRRVVFAAFTGKMQDGGGVAAGQIGDFSQGERGLRSEAASFGG